MNLEEILLTDEGIMEAIGEDYVSKQDILLVKAQAKKLVEWLEEHKSDEGYKAMFYLCIPLEDWQALCQKVGYTKE